MEKVCSQMIKFCLESNPVYQENMRSATDYSRYIPGAGNCYPKEAIHERAREDFTWLRMNGHNEHETKANLANVYQMHSHLLRCKKCLGHYEETFPDSDDSQEHKPKSRRPVFVNAFLNHYRN
ncbi:MAG: hypothetical protein V1870_02840 [Candidatus Aenigmatarchaeota archaeon]